jgi:preprotein translocase subunit Sec63
MDNNKITKTLFLLLLLFIVLFSIVIYKYINLSNTKDIQYDNYEIELQLKQDSFNNLQKHSDSIEILFNSKQATIINNTYIYEQQNKKIGSANVTFTDSLFKANLQSDYKKYGHLITN